MNDMDMKDFFDDSFEDIAPDIEDTGDELAAAELSDEEQAWLREILEGYDARCDETLIQRSDNIDTEILTPVHDRAGESAEAVTEGREQNAACWEYCEDASMSEVNCVRFVINELTGSDITESELCGVMENEDLGQNGFYTGETEELLELFGLDTVSCYDIPVGKLCVELENGARAIVPVSSLLLEGETGFAFFGADAYVEPLSIEYGDSGNGFVTVNHPCREDGCLKQYPLEDFETAWQAGGNAAIFVYSDEAGQSGVTA